MKLIGARNLHTDVWINFGTDIRIQKITKIENTQSSNIQEPSSCSAASLKKKECHVSFSSLLSMPRSLIFKTS